MRFYVIFVFVLAACSKPATQGEKYAHLIINPSMKAALNCVATYEEFCSHYQFPQGKRNRQWIEMQQKHLAKELIKSCLTARQTNTALKDLKGLNDVSCVITKKEVRIALTGKKKLVSVTISACPVSPSGRLLPGYPKMNVQVAHPKRVN